MATYFPPTENLPIFDSAVFEAANSVGISAAEAAALYLKRTGVATSIASSTSFSAEVAATSWTSLNSGATNFHFDNLAGNLAPLIIRNQSTGFDTIYRQLGTTNSHIFQTNGTGTTNLTLSNTANTFGTLGIASQGNLSFSSTNPIISSSSTTNNLRLQGGTGQGIAFLVDAGTTTALTLETTGVLTCNSTLRAIASGTSGFTIQNRSGNTGGLVVLNSDTGSDLFIRQTGARSIIHQVNSVTQLTISSTAVTFVNQTLSTPGAVITAGLTLALPLQDLYFITAAGAITITLPTNAAAYTGSRITFRRTAAGGIITVGQTGGASALQAAGTTTTAVSVAIAAATVTFEFVSNGTLWCQL
jgi:hypothetical protein